jgi:hypothetical protein
MGLRGITWSDPVSFRNIKMINTHAFLFLTILSISTSTLLITIVTNISSPPSEHENHVS